MERGVTSCVDQKASRWNCKQHQQPLHITIDVATCCLCVNGPFCCSQDNWDDEDEDEEKKAEVTKTGTNQIRWTVAVKSCLIFCSLRRFILNFRAQSFWKEEVDGEDQRKRKQTKEKTRGAEEKFAGWSMSNSLSQLNFCQIHKRCRF